MPILNKIDKAFVTDNPSPIYKNLLKDIKTIQTSKYHTTASMMRGGRVEDRKEAYSQERVKVLFLNTVYACTRTEHH